MSSHQFSDQDRKRIAAGWRSSGLGQTEYAARHGIKSRTLRLWLRELSPNLATPDEIRAKGRQVLDALRRAVAVLEESLVQGSVDDRPAVKPVPPVPDDGAASMTITTPRAISSARHSETTKPKRSGTYLFDDDE